MNYTHLTQDERYQIAILNKSGHDQSEIAQLMNRHPSTISRELRRNRPKQAHALSKVRMQACENRPAFLGRPGPWSMPRLSRPGVRSRFPVTSRRMGNPLSATRASTTHLRRQACQWHPASHPALPKGPQEALWRSRATRHDSQSSLHRSAPCHRG